MIRVNLLPLQRKSAQIFGWSVDIEAARRVLGVLTLFATLVAIAGGVQLLRIQRYTAEASLAESLLAANDAPRRSISALAAQVAVLQRIERAARDAHRSGNLTALHLAEIGNAVPHSVWLEAIEWRPDGHLISGAARSLGGVGDLLDALLRTQATARASLVNVARDARREAVRFTIRVSSGPAGAP